MTTTTTTTTSIIARGEGTDSFEADGNVFIVVAFP